MKILLLVLSYLFVLLQTVHSVPVPFSNNNTEIVEHHDSRVNRFSRFGPQKSSRFSHFQQNQPPHHGFHGNVNFPRRSEQFSEHPRSTIEENELRRDVESPANVTAKMNLVSDTGAVSSTETVPDNDLGVVVTGQQGDSSMIEMPSKLHDEMEEETIDSQQSRSIIPSQSGHHSMRLGENQFGRRPIFASHHNMIHFNEPISPRAPISTPPVFHFTAGESNPVLRETSRPSDILIRNKGTDEPKSWIDLRISLDLNGALNIEVGPQNHLNLATPKQDTFVGRNLRDSLRPTALLLKSHSIGPISTRRLMPDYPWHHPEGDSNSHFMNRMRNHEPIFDHQVNRFEQDLEMEMANDDQSDKHDSNSHSSEKNSQRALMGPSEPPFIPKLNSRNTNMHETSITSSVAGQSEGINQRGSQVEGASNIEQEEQQQPRHQKQSQKQQEQKEQTQQRGPEVPDKAGAPSETDTLTSIEGNGDIIQVNVDNFAQSGCPRLKCKSGNSCAGSLFKLDLNDGCPTCDCCAPVSCKKSCSAGFEADDNGCPTCTCAE